MTRVDWYVEYRIEHDRPGLLGDVATLLGLLGCNILSVNAIAGDRRGFLVEMLPVQEAALRTALTAAPEVQLLALRPPTLEDLVTMRHGRPLAVVPGSPPVYRFRRTELEVLIDFLGEALRATPAPVIGVRGLPKVGKTEATIAACVHANRRWVVVSGTIFRQTIRTRLSPEEVSADCVMLIDGITSASHPLPEHRALLQEVLAAPLPKVVEHPDALVQEGLITPERLTMVVEIRRDEHDSVGAERITSSTSSFDVS